MSSLRTLDISGTNQVFYLPKTFCQIQTLEVLLLAKPHCMEYPPPSMCDEFLLLLLFGKMHFLFSMIPRIILSVTVFKLFWYNSE